MKSVGEAMAIGRTFQERSRRRCGRSRRAVRSQCDPARSTTGSTDERCWPQSHCRRRRLFQLEALLRRACRSRRSTSARDRPVVPRSDARSIDRGAGRLDLSSTDDRARAGGGPSSSDSPIASSPTWDRTEDEVRAARMRLGGPDVQDGRHLRRRVRGRARPTTTRPTRTRRGPTATGEKVMILGSGPNRIGQGIEFDYCCVHARFALREPASRPSWSTATPRPCRPTTTRATAVLRTADLGRRARHHRAEQPDGVIVQLGGQTPLKLAAARRTGVDLGTSPESIDWPRTASSGCSCARLEIPQPPGGTAVDSTRRSRSPSRSATRCWCARATCSAVGRWRSSTTTTARRRWTTAASAARKVACRRNARCSSTASSKTPPRSTSMPSVTTRAKSVIGGSHGARRGGRGALR